MRSGGVERAAESFNVELRIQQREKPVLIEALVTQAPVEALDVRILHRLPRLDEVEGDAAIGGRRIEGATAKRTAIVERETDGLPPPIPNACSASRTCGIRKSVTAGSWPALLGDGNTISDRKKGVDAKRTRLRSASPSRRAVDAAPRIEKICSWSRETLSSHSSTGLTLLANRREVIANCIATKDSNEWSLA